MARDYLRQARRNLVRTIQVAAMRGSLNSLLPQFPYRLLGFRGRRPVRNRHIRTSARICERDGATNALGGAGYEGGLALKRLGVGKIQGG
jgi:hypothetical protein